MVTMDEIPPVETGLMKQSNTSWEPVYSLYTPNGMNENTTDIVIQELINRQIIFEALHYFSIAGLGCGRTV